MKMRYRKIFSALAFALLLGFAAQPASAQHRNGAPPPPPPHYGPGPRGQFHPRQYAAQHGNAPGGANHNPYQSGRPANGPRPPSTFQPPPHNNTAQNPGAAGAAGNSRPGQFPNQNQNTGRPPTTSSALNAQNGANPNSTRLPGQWSQKLGQMSPQQQDRFLQNNERFKSMPPERQQQIRQNLQNYNRLSPTERNAMKDRAETWKRMSPDQQQYVQHTLLPKWQQMSPDRKQAVTDRLHTLQGMTPEDRQKSLNDPQFMRGLNPDEQSVLRGLDQVRNPSNP
jgi:hypothetical protein